MLQDPEKREIYDQYGEDALKEGMGSGGGGVNPFDIFESFFGGGGGMGASPSRCWLRNLPTHEETSKFEKSLSWFCLANHNNPRTPKPFNLAFRKLSRARVTTVRYLFEPLLIAVTLR